MHFPFQITLSWDRCLQLFNYFKPRSIPEFDSLKTNTVSAEVNFVVLYNTLKHF